MILNIISILLILGSFAAIFFIVSRYADVLSAIDVDTLPQEKESEVKNKLVRDRIARKLSSAWDFLHLLFGPLKKLSEIVSGPFHKWYQSLLAVREAHRKGGMASIETAALKGEALDMHINELLAEAETYEQDGRLPEAEKKYIEVVSVEPKEVRAYKGLADIYMYQKEWSQAKDVLKYACRLLGDEVERLGDDAPGDLIQRLVYSLYDLSVVFNALSLEEKALASLKQAQELDTKNPKILDALVEQYILLGQRMKAERVLVLLKAANEGNKKVDDFEARIRNLSY